MGVEFHITRADFWADNENAWITAEEWLRYISSDRELNHCLSNGPYHAVWAGPSLHDAPWLDWYSGNIYTKWPDTCLYRKMLKIAETLNARLMDDEGTVYSDDSQWQYDPSCSGQ